MGLTKREESELRFGWPARVSRPIAFLFTAFYHATGLKRCNNAYKSVMWLTSLRSLEKTERRPAICRAKVALVPGSKLISDRSKVREANFIPCARPTGRNMKRLS